MMHARELVELAAMVSSHGSVLIRGREPIPAQGIERYWTASKIRLDRWSRRLRLFTHSEADIDVLGTLEEILTSEMLTRVWTAVLCACDRSRGTDQSEPVARSVWIGHSEARHRVLTLMARGDRLGGESAIRLNRLRRRVECWTDVLMGRLGNIHGVGEFAFDPRRAMDFADDLRRRGAATSGARLVWPLLTASLQEAFRRELCPESPNADLNAQVAAAVLSCFPADRFDSLGLPLSLWRMRLAAAQADTLAMVDRLLGPKLSRSDRFGR